MPGLLVVGVSHHRAPLDIRERIAVSQQQWQSVAPHGMPTVLLSTCNRVEVYTWCETRPSAAAGKLERSVARAAGVSLSELEPHLTRLRGRDALLHLVRVASGLDSLVVGEDQIRGQLREAVREAELSQPLPPGLRGVFQRASESARHIRGATNLGKLPSIASAAVHVARRALPQGLAEQQVVVLGSGVMARAATECLLTFGANVLVLNRTLEHAQRLMGALGPRVTVGGLHQLPTALRTATLVIGATASRQPILSLELAREAVQTRQAQPLLMVDIAVPRDIDARVRQLQGVQLLDLDDLERECPIDVSVRQAEVQRGEQLAQEEADRLAQWLRFRSVSPAIAELRTFGETVRVRELRRSSARLRDLTPEQIAAVDALTSGIVKKLLHGPTVALRDAGAHRSRSRILRVVRPSAGRSA